MNTEDSSGVNQAEQARSPGIGDQHGYHVVTRAALSRNLYMASQGADKAWQLKHLAAGSQERRYYDQACPGPILVDAITRSDTPEIAALADEWQGIAIPTSGVLAVIGTAGTGKTTTLQAFERHLREKEPSRKVVRLAYLETDYPAQDVIASDDVFAWQLASAFAQAWKGGVVVIDSLRAWVTLGTGYEQRLSAGGWDMAMFPALTQLDLAARRAGVLVVAAVYVEAMQIGAAAPGDKMRSDALLHLLLRSIDGAVTTSVLLGPSSTQRGQFYTLTRLRGRDGQSLRQATAIAGTIRLSDGGAAAPAAPEEVTLTLSTGNLTLQGHGAYWASRVMDASPSMQRRFTEERATNFGQAADRMSQMLASIRSQK